MNGDSLELHIEELVLHGFAPGDRRTIGDAVQSELLRLFSEQKMSPEIAGLGALDRVDAGTISVGPSTKPARVGEQVAHNVHRGIGGSLP